MSAQEASRGSRCCRCRPSASATCSSTRSPGPTKDVRVRRAIAHAIDRPALIDALLAGLRQAGEHRPDAGQFRLRRGRQGLRPRSREGAALLKEARRGGRRPDLPHRRPPTTSGWSEAIQQMIQEVGLKVDDLDARPPDLPAPPPGEAGRGRQPLGRALVLRLPGRRRRDLPAVPHRSDLGEVRQPGLRRGRSTPGPRDARRGRAPEALPARPSRSSREDVPGVGLYQDFAIYGGAQGAAVEADRERGLLRHGHEVAAVACAALARRPRWVATSSAALAPGGWSRSSACSTIVFVVMRLSGDPTLLLVPEGASREHIEQLRRQLGFDRPILVQYARLPGATWCASISAPRSSSASPAAEHRRLAHPLHADCWPPARS